MSETTWIYGLICPLKNRVRYVGASYQPVVRYRAHTAPGRTNYGMRMPEESKEGWIARLREEHGKRPGLVLLEEVEGRARGGGSNQPQAVRDAEHHWIRKLISEGHPLTNTRLPMDLVPNEDEILFREALERGKQMFGESA